MWVNKDRNFPFRQLLAYWTYFYLIIYCIFESHMMLSPRAASEPGLPLISCYVFKASKVSICPWHFSVGILKKGSLKRRPFPLGWARESTAYWWPVMWQRTLTSRTVCDAQGEAGSAQERCDAGFMAAVTGHNKRQVRPVTRCQQHSVITPLLWWGFMWAGATVIGGEADPLSQET